MALPYGKLKLFAVLFLILINGLLQLVGVTSVFPFFALAADPERIRKSAFGGWLLNLLPPMSTNHLLVTAGCFAIIMLVLASLGSMVSEFLRIRYAYGFCHWLRIRLFEFYGGRPYAFFLHRNSAELNQRIFDCQAFTQNVFLPVGEILTRLVLVFLLVGAVFLVQPWVAMGAVMIFGGFYLVIFLWLRSRTRTIADGLQLHNVGFWKNTNQFLQGIKPMLVHGKGRYFTNRALEHSARIGHFQSKIPVYGNGPRYLIEPVAFGGLVAIVVVMALRGHPFADILPNLSVMALAGYRLLPTLQLLYSQLITVAANNYTLTQLEEEIFDLPGEMSAANPSSSRSLNFNREIRMENLTFQYPGAKAAVLNGFSLTITKNESVGIVGPSGTGKSTVVDLILGLHLAQAGAIQVDGVPLAQSDMARWRSMIGYVPQDIYLLDASIAENIAFGVPPDEIDKSCLREAAKAAQILAFIEEELPANWQTMVGERGVRLSGGQRQRIGLARALYHLPQVLILDEATSALDTATESEVMKAINALKGSITMVVIAHRLSTLEHCDKVMRLETASLTSSTSPATNVAA